MHEDLIAWDEDERKQCREEWEQRVSDCVHYIFSRHPLLGREHAINEAGLAAVRELRKLRRKVGEV